MSMSSTLCRARPNIRMTLKAKSWMALSILLSLINSSKKSLALLRVESRSKEYLVF